MLIVDYERYNQSEGNIREEISGWSKEQNFQVFHSWT